jgi:hypothetical protein
MLQLITILNRCHRFPGFVYQQARFSSDHKRRVDCRRCQAVVVEEVRWSDGSAPSPGAYMLFLAR